ncbi:MAG: hypothetical protein GX936_08045, partial [Clostridiales bacterium]|nr:hypothetical protein [Clostridiales bacterium]
MHAIGAIGGKKNRRGGKRSAAGAIKIKRVAASAFILAVIMLGAMATPCFGEENGIPWTEDELDFMEEHPVI